MAIEKGARFSTYEDFRIALKRHEVDCGVLYVTKNSKKLKKESPYLETLKYESIHFACKQGIRTRESTSQGIRPNQRTFKIGCPSFINLHVVYGGDNQHFKVTTCNLVHENHPTGKEEHLVKSYNEDLSMNANHCDSMGQGNIDTAEVKPPVSCFDNTEMCVHPGIMSRHAEEVNMEAKTDLFKAAWKMKTLKLEERQVSETTMDCHSGQLNSKMEQNMNNVCLQNGDCVRPPDGEIRILGYNSITSASGVTGLVLSSCSEKEIYRCDVYGLGCNDNAGFVNDHTYFYTGQTPITCDFCEAKFCNIWFLKDHMIIHSDEKTLKLEEKVPETMMDCHSGQLNSQVEQNMNRVCLQNGDCINPPDGEISILGSNSIASASSVTGLVDSNCAEKESYRCDVYGLGYNDNAGFINDMIYSYTGQTSITCGFCDTKFSNIWLLKDHMITHLDKKTYKCDVCGETFFFELSLIQHKKVHTRIKSFKCGVCGDIFSDKLALIHHKQIHTGMKPFKCDVCGEIFSYKISLNKHKQVHSEIKPFKCGVCSETFSLLISLTQHEKFHTIKPFKCDICGETFSHKHSLLKHKKIHTGIRPFKCDVCGASFFKGHCLTRHKTRIHRKNKPYSCAICDISFASLHRFNMHKRIHLGEKPYKCDDCGRRFATHGKLKVHIQIHTGEKPHQCEDCGAVFSQKNGLKYHRRIHTGEEPYKCDICSKAIVSLYSLKMHKRIHTGEKPYTCDVCSKAFVNLVSLKMHKRIHTGEKPYTCNVCSKEFIKSSALKQHTRVHTGEKPFTCDVCGTSFTQKGHLKVHNRIHTGEKPYACDACCAEFSQKRGLKSHRRIHTGQRRVKIVV